MQRFKVKDLMVNVFPDEVEIDCGRFISRRPCWFTVSRPIPTNCWWVPSRPITTITTTITTTCPGISTGCPGVTIPDTTTIWQDTTPIQDITEQLEQVPVETLQLLKGQLRDAIGKVEAREARVNEALLPQTVEAAALVEQKLMDALHEIRVHKEQLQSKDSAAAAE